MNGRWLLPAWLGALGALTGCVYTFGNPVTLQDAGSVTGSIVLDGGASGQIVGTRVDLLWSNLSIDLGPSGRFVFLDLPDGTYTLRYTVPAATAGGTPTVGELLDIYLPFTGASVPDTIALGAISVDLPGTVEGTITVDGGPAAGAVVGAFVPGDDAGVIEYEGYATAADSSGHYSLLLPHGNHAIWASTVVAAASLDIDGLNPGEDRTGQDLSLGAPAQPGSQLSGYVVVDPDGAHAPESVVEPILSDPFTVDLLPECSSCQTRLSYGPAVPSQGVAAAQVSVTGLAAGAFYQVTCSLPSTSPPIPAVVLPDIPIIAGEVTFLRQIFMLTQTTLDANGALPLNAGTDGGSGDAGLDASVDAGHDAGPADAGPSDAGIDAGLDAGIDAGFDAGPPDAGSSCGPPADAGLATWTVTQLQAPNGFGVDAVVPLPLPGGFQSFVFSEAPGGIYEVDNRSKSFGSAVSFWDGGGLGGEVAGTLIGSSLGQGAQNFVAWSSSTNSSTGPNVPLAAIQIDGGTWNLLSTIGLSALLTSPQPLATVYDPSGNAWLAEVTSGSDIELAPLPGAKPVTDLGFPNAGVNMNALAATPCSAADGGASICVVSCGSNANAASSAWLTVFDPITQAFETSQIYSAPAGGTISAVAVTALGCGYLEIALALASDPSQYLWAMTLPGQLPSFDAGSPTSNGPPGLFPWRGSALLVNLDSDSQFEDVASLGPWPAPALPPDAGTAEYVARGYVDSSGAVYIGLVDTVPVVGTNFSTSYIDLCQLPP